MIRTFRQYRSILRREYFNNVSYSTLSGPYISALVAVPPTKRIQNSKLPNVSNVIPAGVIVLFTVPQVFSVAEGILCQDRLLPVLLTVACLPKEYLVVYALKFWAPSLSFLLFTQAVPHLGAEIALAPYRSLKGLVVVM